MPEKKLSLCWKLYCTFQDIKPYKYAEKQVLSYSQKCKQVVYEKWEKNYWKKEVSDIYMYKITEQMVDTKSKAHTCQ